MNSRSAKRNQKQAQELAHFFRARCHFRSLGSLPSRYVWDILKRDERLILSSLLFHVWMTSGETTRIQRWTGQPLWGFDFHSWYLSAPVCIRLYKFRAHDNSSAKKSLFKLLLMLLSLALHNKLVACFFFLYFVVIYRRLSYLLGSLYVSPDHDKNPVNFTTEKIQNIESDEMNLSATSLTESRVRFTI